MAPPPESLMQPHASCVAVVRSFGLSEPNFLTCHMQMVALSERENWNRT